MTREEKIEEALRNLLAEAQPFLWIDSFNESPSSRSLSDAAKRARAALALPKGETKRDDAGAVREECAKIVDAEAYVWSRGKSHECLTIAAALHAAARTIRALPDAPPAPESKVERARREFYEAASDYYAEHDGVEIAGAGLNRVRTFMDACARLYAAERDAGRGA